MVQLTNRSVEIRTACVNSAAVGHESSSCVHGTRYRSVSDNSFHVSICKIGVSSDVRAVNSCLLDQSCCRADACGGWRSSGSDCPSGSSIGEACFSWYPGSHNERNSILKDPTPAGANCGSRRILGCALQDVLLRKIRCRRRPPTCNHNDGFIEGSCSESPAWPAISLTLYCGHFSLGPPVDLEREASSKLHFRSCRIWIIRLDQWSDPELNWISIYLRFIYS